MLRSRDSWHATSAGKIPLVPPVTPYAFKTTQAKAIQDRLGGEGRRPREDRRASSDPRHSVERKAQGETAQAQTHAGKAAGLQPVDRSRSGGAPLYRLLKKSSARSFCVRARLQSGLCT